jgi:uncharacterized repeat protein (TIGR01451 family)
MKLKSKTTSLMFRLVSLATALLLGQQALAVGTEAGTSVTNTASVDYFVLGVDQADIPSNTVTFLVDRRVNFTLTPASTPDLLPVSPGGTDYFVDFYLANASNSDLDFDLGLLEAALGIDVDGSGADTADMGTLEYAISSTTVSGGDVDPVRGSNTGIVDELGSDESIRIRVYGDAALTLANNDIVGAQLTATAFEAGGAGLGAALDWVTAPTDGVVDNVDVNANNGVQVAVDGFLVNAANLTVAKDYSVIDGDLGSGLPLPGARLEYEILISNAAGASDATNIVVSDLIDTDLTFLTGGTGSDYTDIEYFDGTTATECTADDGDANGDGCSLDVAGNMVVGDPTDLPITISGGGSFRVRFQVRIPDPATTP